MLYLGLYASPFLFFIEIQMHIIWAYVQRIALELSHGPYMIRSDNSDKSNTFGREEKKRLSVIAKWSNFHFAAPAISLIWHYSGLRLKQKRIFSRGAVFKKVNVQAIKMDIAMPKVQAIKRIGFVSSVIEMRFKKWILIFSRNAFIQKLHTKISSR